MDSNGRKILIADDDLGTREFYRELFEDAGYAVIAVEDPASVSLCVRTFDPDILLLDWDMPGGGGKLVYDTVMVELGRKVPAIFATGFPERVSFRSDGSLTILKKPAGMQLLLSEADRLLGGG